MANHRAVTLPASLVAVLLGILAPACAGSQPAEPVAAAPPAPSVATPAAARVAATAPPAATEPKEAKVEKAISEAPYGSVGGTEVKLYTLRNKNGLVLKVTNYGCIVTELDAPDKSGKLADIVLGYDKLDDYLKATPYFGSVIGRVANRIKNAQFSLGGKTIKLEVNNEKNALHGGKVGWDKVIWSAEPSETPDGPSIKFTYVSKDGEEHYPGTVTAHNTYTLTNNNEFKVEMDATTDKTTVVSMAHHTYWNLGGQDSGPIGGEELTLFADQYTPGPNPTDPVPDGKVKAVKGTPFDFTAPKVIDKELKETSGKPIGYDVNYVVRGDAHTLRPVAKLRDPKTGRVLELSADQPGVQFYTGNFLDGSNKGKGGVVYQQYTGLCLESQKFPNSINVPAWKDEVTLKPGATYHHTMIHKLSAE